MSVFSLKRSRVERREYGLASIWATGEQFIAQGMFARVLQLFRQSTRSLAQAPLSAALTVLTIALALFLLSVFLIVGGQASRLVLVSADAIQVQAYLKDRVGEENVTEEAARAVLERVRTVAPKANVSYVSKSDALRFYVERFGGADQQLQVDLGVENPLPASIMIAVSMNEDAPRQLAALRELLAREAPIQSVEFSDELAQRVGAVADLLHDAGVAAIGLILIVVCFIVGTTIQLALLVHRDELEIMKLVGATDVAVQAPYMVEGVLQGILGAITGIAASYLVFQLLVEQLSRIALVQVFLGSMHFLSASQMLIILCAGVVLGVVGSFLASYRFIRSL